MQIVGILAITIITLTAVFPVILADQAKSRLLSLSSLTIDRESRWVLGGGIILSSLLFTVFWLELIANQNLSQWLKYLAVLNGLAFVIVGALLLFQQIPAHYFWVRLYLLTSFILQVGIGIEVAEQTLFPVLMAIVNTVTTTTMYIYWTKQDRFYFEWNYVFWSCLYVGYLLTL